MNVSNQETIDLILSLRKEGKTYAQIMEITVYGGNMDLIGY